MSSEDALYAIKGAVSAYRATTMPNEPQPQHLALRIQHKQLENVVVLYLTQAMLGLIGPNVRAVAIELQPERLVVHFALASLDETEREDIEDVLGDLDALLDNEDLEGEWNLPPTWTIDASPHVGPPDDTWPGCQHRRVFETKHSRVSLDSRGHR